MTSCRLVTLLILLSSWLHVEGADSLAKLRFNHDIRPILSDKCFYCHGPDSKKREADLRLDVREAAVKDGHIVPGQPEKSLIIERVLSHDADELMPPPKSKLGALTSSEILTLKRWIAEGAEYEAHWSFIPLKSEAGKDGIDAVLDAGLLERGMKMQPEAAPETLIRRACFDLTGLPPSPDEVTAFVKEYQASPQAYEKLVSRLLSSPHYGERMAVDWLDMARYADSYGFQVDREREVWPWRDWVVRAFNQNLRFDQFIIWQLAGDLLPNPTDDQMLATAFNRLHQQESEGGSVEEEYRVEYVADRVQTVATAFLGLTFECARCHDHKYDPITQKEYYGLFSMLQNIDEAGLYSYFTPAPPTPAMMLMDDAAKERMAALRKKVEGLEKKFEKVERLRELRLQAGYEAQQRQAAKGSPNGGQGESKPGPGQGMLAHFAFDEMKGNKLVNALNTDGKMAATLKGENKLVAGKFGQAIQFTGDDAVVTPLGNFSRHDAFSVSLWMKTPDVKDRAVVFHRSRAWTDAASRGYELLIEDGKLKWSLIHFWPGNAISIRTTDLLPVSEWTQVAVTYDGSSRASGLRIYVNEKLAPVEVIRDGLTKTIMGGGGDNIALGERFRDRGFKGGLIDDFRVFNRDLSLAVDPPDELKKARSELYALQDAQKEIMVMRELPQPKKAYVLTRGEYDKRADEVGPATPAALSPFPKNTPANRLGLARWLTAPDHPLTARVTVNRIWQSVFGRGLVKTSEDFGSQGEKPMYPALLDGLSVRFMQSGWDMKALMKEIVMSRAYRQRSIADAKTMVDDPENQWLARGPRFRLPAEMIRDNALSAAGLLKKNLGGAPVYPYEMTEAFKPVGPSAGDEVYRRSLYTNWRRTSPPPAMVAFDAPRRAVCSAKRERTDSPLQSLILLNGVQYVEAARVLGEKLHQEEKGDVKGMIRQGFLRCLSRRPDDREIAICMRLYQEQLAHFKANPKEAASLLKTGASQRDEKISAHEAAAATVLAQALMSHDECVVKR